MQGCRLATKFNSSIISWSLRLCAGVIGCGFSSLKQVALTMGPLTTLTVTKMPTC